MDRIEAVESVGRRVTAITAMNGVYVGVLSSVNARLGAPWRGVVTVEGVLEVAHHFHDGQYGRRGHRPGETIEVGAKSIELTNLVGAPTYEEALLNHIEWVRLEVMRIRSDAKKKELLAIGRGSQQALKAERLRLKTGEWVLQSA